jgi:hypothetical protein
LNIITGTHRSGTSLVSRLLHRAGADFGATEGFYPADQWNPDGYFEQSEILQLNRKILQGAWGKFANIIPPSTARIRQRGRENAEAIRRAIVRFGACTIKDPRFNYTGPAWEDQGANIERFVVCVREPMDVALSLQRRNHLPIVVGLHVWRDCLQRLLDNYNHRQMWFVDYARLTAPATCIDEASSIIRFLGLNYQQDHDAGWIRAFIRTSEFTASRHVYPAKVDTVWRHCLVLTGNQRMRPHTTSMLGRQN